MVQLSFQQAQLSDAESLAQLRVTAMKPSLEAVGRFEPERARRRFLDKYDPEATQKILCQGQLIGFYVVLEKRNHYWLDHLYIAPDYQGRGIGQQIIQTIQRKANRQNKAVCLCALKGSPANDFYKQQGFTVQSTDEWDIYYQWFG